MTDPIQNLEETLETEARLLSGVAVVPPDVILAKYRRRMFRQRLTRSGAAGVLMLAAAAWAMCLSRGADDRMAGSGQSDRVVSKVGGVATDNSKPSLPEVAADPIGSDLGSLAVPIGFVRQTPDGPVIESEFFIRPHTSPVNYSRLSPVQRRAVREVLGIKEPTANRNAI